MKARGKKADADRVKNLFFLGNRLKRDGWIDDSNVSNVMGKVKRACYRR